MSTLRTMTLAAALVAGATSLTMAQNGPGGANGNNGNGMPPSGYLGPGGYPTYKSSDFRLPSNASNTMPPGTYQGPGGYPSYKSSEFQQGNPTAIAAANGRNGMQQRPSRYGQRGLYAYQPSYDCRRLRLEGRYLPRSCR